MVNPSIPVIFLRYCVTAGYQSKDMNPNNLTPLIAGTVLVTLLVVFIIFVVILYRKAQLKFELERQQFQQALLQAEVEIRDQTLSDVSRDLHDNLGQIASLIKINLNMVSDALGDDDRVRIEESRELLKKLMSDFRTLSSSLATRDLRQMSLLRLIEADVERINRSGFIDIKMLSKPEEPELNPEISIFIYRMFQELINNILKHSGASRARVNVVNEGDRLLLQVSDNGRGMDASLLEAGKTPGGGNGLGNIRERCRIIGASCTFESSPNKGTFIEISLPVKPTHAFDTHVSRPDISGG